MAGIALYQTMSASPFGSRGMGLTLTTDNGTQFTSARYVETLNQLGITHRRTAYNHPEGNSYIERFHRSLKELGGVAPRVPELRPGRAEHRTLDRGVQLRPFRIADSTDEPRTTFAPGSPKPLLQTRPHVSSSEGCTAHPWPIRFT